MKGKIISIANKQRTLWIWLKKRKNILEKLDKIVSKFYDYEFLEEKEGSLKYIIDDGGNKTDERGKVIPSKYIPAKYKDYIGKVLYFFEEDFCVNKEDEALYLFFKEEEVLAILFKDSPKFEDLRKSFLEEFQN